MTNLEPTEQWPMVIQSSPGKLDGATPTPARDQHGRFLTGNIGGGRRKGSRNKLTETFLDAIANDFAEHGTEAIARVRASDPATYLRLIGSIVPKELILQREQSPPINWDDITQEELLEFIERVRKQKAMEGIVQSIR